MNILLLDVWGKISRFIAGIFALCFANKAKEENGGTLSKKAKRYLMMGVIGFCVWLLLFVVMFASIA